MRYIFSFLRLPSDEVHILLRLERPMNSAEIVLNCVATYNCIVCSLSLLIKTVGEELPELNRTGLELNKTSFGEMLNKGIAFA